MRQASDPIKRFSTEDVPATQRFDYWSSVLSRAISPMTVTSEDVLGFEARTCQTALGPLDVNRTQGTAHTSRHTKSDVERSEDCNYHLLVSLDRPWQLSHRGNVRLASGDLVLTDSRIEHVIDIHASYDILNVILPVNWLRTWIPNPDCLVGRRIPRGSRWGKVLSPMASKLIPEFVATAPIPHGVLADHIGGMLALLSGSFPEQSRADRELLRRLEDCVQERCMEPQLTASDVARSLGVPARALHRALGASGFTFASRLFQTRVARGIQLLKSPAHASLEIAQIARLAGFSDGAHLTRAVKSCLGIDLTRLRPRRVKNDHER